MELADSTITIEDFAKIKMVIGTIVEARPHPDADKLMILRVDIGVEGKHELAVVAGIKKHYTAETLLNRQIVLVTNLPERAMRGETSHGMLLAASDTEGNLALLSPDKPMKPGSEVG